MKKPSVALFSCQVVSSALWPHRLLNARLSVLHFLPEFAQIHVHWVSDNHLILSHPFLPFYKELKITVYTSSWPKWCTTRCKKKDSKPNSHFWRARSKHGVSRAKAGRVPAHSTTAGVGKPPSHPRPNSLLKTLLSDCKALRGTRRTSLKRCFSGWTVHWVAIFYFSGFVFFFFKILHHLPLCFLSFLHSAHDYWATGKWGKFF